MTFDSRWKDPQSKSPEHLHDAIVQIVRELRKGNYLAGAIPGTGIPNSDLADMAAWTIKLRNNAVAGDPQDLRVDELTLDADPTEAGDLLLGADANQELRKFSTRLVGGIHLLNSGTVVNAAQLDVVLTSFTAYRALKFVLSSFVPATDDQQLTMQFSTNGGSSFVAANYRYAIGGFDSSGASREVTSAAATAIVIAGDAAGSTVGISNVATAGGCHCDVTLFNQAAANRTRVMFMSAYQTSVDRSASGTGAGDNTTAQDTDAVRFLFTAGNIASGSWALYGYV